MNGIVNIIKPAGMTSSNVVADVRRATKVLRVGHCGTLDPGAAGVLPVCLGRSTRLFNYLLDKKKSYRFEALFGVATDTLDSYGKIVNEHKQVCVKLEQVSSVLNSLTGEILQQPPMYSALSSGGQKLYKMARAGKTVDLASKARMVSIHSLQLVEQTGVNRFLFDVSCSSGTYVRVLAEQIAQKLGTIACVSFLLRTAAGPFTLENGIALFQALELANDNALQDKLIDPQDALDFPILNATPICFKRLRDGLDQELSWFDFKTPPIEGDFFKLYSQDIFLGVATIKNAKLRLATLLGND